MTLSRRSFLKLLPLNLLPGIALASASSALAEGAPLSQWFSDSAVTARVARSFVQTEAFDRRSLDELAQSFERERALRRGAGERCISSAIQKDFYSGDVVVVDGWVFARTEANLCVLAALETQA